MDVTTALSVIDDVLCGLEALHGQGIVHRDLKPTNVFLVSTGAKLLDFGLARSLEPTDVNLTQPGLLIGTPRYMAPEQWVSQPVSEATDLFAVAAMLYEMLTGEFAFGGETAIEIYKAVTSGQPPALTGADAVESVDRVIRRGLAKKPQDRFPSAQAMREALQGASIGDDKTLVQYEVRQVTRLMVLPFRLLRPDEEIDFLSFSLADAITASLSGMRSLIVRAQSVSNLSGAGPPDIAAIGRDSDVDAVLFGTLLRAGTRVRLTTQLVQVPDGTVIATNTSEAGLDDVFALQDELAEKVTRSLAVPLGEQEERHERQDVPASGEAYEKYLRANELARKTLSPSLLKAARDLYRESVDLDPTFAPAWARLGRIHRVLAKYGYVEGTSDLSLAEEAFDRALKINPDLPIAHNLLTYFQIEERADAVGAMERLLSRVARVPDPNLYSGLVAACRFCGLLDASIAAHNEARRLNSKIHTSVAYTYWILGRLDRAAEEDSQEIPFLQLFADTLRGRQEEVRKTERALDERLSEGVERDIFRTQRAAMEGNREECLEAARRIEESPFEDPEGLMFVARALLEVGASDKGLDLCEFGLDRGYACLHLLDWDPVFAGLGSNARFQSLTERSRQASQAAQARFLAAGGASLLGI
jgi:serine/threonine-protein kinase